MSSFKSTILQASYFAHMKASEELFRSGHTERGNQINDAANEINALLVKEQEREIKANKSEEEKVNKLMAIYKKEKDDSDNSGCSEEWYDRER